MIFRFLLILILELGLLGLLLTMVLRIPVLLLLLMMLLLLRLLVLKGQIEILSLLRLQGDRTGLVVFKRPESVLGSFLSAQFFKLHRE